MGLPIACCPYCDGDTFKEAFRADAVNPRRPERFSEVYGHWFNQCAGCDGWSLHQEGRQIAIGNKGNRPRAYSLPHID